MRFLRRKKARSSTGLAPLVSAGGFENSDKCEISSNNPNPEEFNPFGIDPFANDPFGKDPCEPPVFEHSKKHEARKVAKDSGKPFFNKSKKVDSKYEKGKQDKSDSIDTFDESTTSTARMTECNEESVRPVLISVKAPEESESTEFNEVFPTSPTSTFSSPSRHSGSSYDLQDAFSEDPFNMSPVSPGFPASPMSGTTGTVDKSVTTLSVTETMNESTMNESTMTGISTLESWDNDSTTRYTRDSECDATTLGSESTRRSKRRIQWKLPKGLPKAARDAIFVLQDMVEDFSTCGAFVARTAENNVCGPEEGEEPLTQAWETIKLTDQNLVKGQRLSTERK